MKPFALVALVALLAGGCGGASTSSDLYTRAATKRCARQTLRIHAVAPSSDDFVASTASNGALRVHLPDNNAVTLLFGASTEEANNLADAYRRFRAKNVGIEDVLRTKNNVTLLWQSHPQTADESSVDGCLK